MECRLAVRENAQAAVDDCSNKLAVDTDDKQFHAFIACRGCQALASSKSIPPLPPCSEHKYKSNLCIG
ncbi:hypothetical protein PVAP13_7KG207655 [Panicum virgatum]|uniref:Uncharacterized protein n=1 Tax=Panicum virgatum TaxID=38727 RepID=A0A8T0QHD0_PANVG|nr:hypothetical protein PVAP13_7KG207655 [Panicum virgatum]